ncbi:MAG: HAMP domain-containing histidine kinase [Clostridiales bacterium]|nr:HAMP domain-containing histidine kinase [Clostridiales bacterium]
MNKSIFAKTYIIILGTITAVLLLSWLIISFYADDYYYNRKIGQIEEASRSIRDILENSMDSEEAVIELRKLSIQTGADISIFNAENQFIYADFIMNNNRMGMNFEIQVRTIPRAVFGIEKGKHVVLKSTVQSEKIDKYIYGERYPSGILTVIQIPIETIDEAVKILRDIIRNMMFAAFILGAIGAYILSKNITKPLLELNSIALHMSKLDFTKKYTEKREDEIGQLGYTLNKMANELQLSIKQLQDELKKEKTLDILRKQFVAQVSHEMQTPLSVVQGYVEALEDGIIDSEEEKKYHYEVIKDEIHKMTRIIRDLLDLSQLEAGTFKIKKDTFDITNLIKKISDKYAEIAKQKNINFYTSLTEKEVYIYGDQLRIEQVLTNLIKNAFEHTEEKGNIEIKSIFYDNKIKVVVFNTGSRIAEEDIPYLWKSFYKANGKKESKGTGLGLAISKHILDLHNAEYGVENVEEGVNFWCEFHTKNSR